MVEEEEAVLETGVGEGDGRGDGGGGGERQRGVGGNEMLYSSTWSSSTDLH